jgi:hypothetical protein
MADPDFVGVVISLTSPTVVDAEIQYSFKLDPRTIEPPIAEPDTVFTIPISHPHAEGVMAVVCAGYLRAVRTQVGLMPPKDRHRVDWVQLREP